MSYTPEQELELCRREFNDAGRLVRERQSALEAAYQELVKASERYGAAEEAVRHGGYGEPSPGQCGDCLCEGFHAEGCKA